MTHISGTNPNYGIEVADFAAEGLDATERIGREIERPRRTIFRRAVMVLGLGGIAAAGYTEPQLVMRTWNTIAPYAQSLMEAARTPPTATAVVPPTGEAAQSEAVAAPAERLAALPAEKPKPPTQTEPASAPAPVSPTPAETIKPPPRSAVAESPKASPGDAYAAPKTAPPDALLKRAEAAGLHPDLSRALLQKLSDADFKTAATAVNKALTEVGDTETFIWPQKAAKTATRFRISFVPGAPQDCRRYVVEIAKDGWQTTALPVEKCGVKRVAARG